MNQTKKSGTLMVTVATAIAGCLGLLFFFVVFGSMFGWFIAVCMGVFGMFWVHYQLWGRAMEATPEDVAPEDG